MTSKTYRCLDHGFTLEIQGNTRRLTTPPPASVRDRAQGISGECALPTCPMYRVAAGEMGRRHPEDDSPLAGTCHIVEVR